jgi:hypothetical protein
MRDARLLRALAIGGVAGVCMIGVVAGVAAAAPPKAKCPSASLVGAALGVHLSGPISMSTSFAKVCSYKTRSGVVPMRISFQKDTAASFAAGENAVPKSVRVTVKGLGKAAYGTKVGGFLAVFLGGESIRITAPGASLARLETLAHKLI